MGLVPRLLLSAWLAFGAGTNLMAAGPPSDPPPASAVVNEPVPAAVAVTSGGAPRVGQSKRIDWLSSLEFSLSISVLVFGTLVFLAELFVIKAGLYPPNDSTKLLTVTLIIVATLFIITAGFSSEQIAPAMGLFGTVAGYLLGRTQSSTTESPHA